MARKLVVGNFTEATPWKEGRIVAGIFRRIEEIPKCLSRKVTLDQTGQGDDVAVWETKSLALYLAQLRPGDWVMIRCDGKEQYAGGEGWAFSVAILDKTDAELCIRAFANKSPLPPEFVALTLDS